MTPVEHDVALAAQLVAAVSAHDVVRTIHILDAACNDGRIRELALATAGQAVAVTAQLWDNQDVQQALDLHAMSMMGDLSE